MSQHERTILARSLASCLMAGSLSSYHALAMMADDETILKAIVLFRASRASMR